MQTIYFQFIPTKKFEDQCLYDYMYRYIFVDALKMWDPRMLSECKCAWVGYAF